RPSRRRAPSRQCAIRRLSTYRQFASVESGATPRPATIRSRPALRRATRPCAREDRRPRRHLGRARGAVEPSRRAIRLVLQPYVPQAPPTLRALPIQRRAAPRLDVASQGTTRARRRQGRWRIRVRRTTSRRATRRRGPAWRRESRGHGGARRSDATARRSPTGTRVARTSPRSFLGGGYARPFGAATDTWQFHHRSAGDAARARGRATRGALRRWAVTRRVAARRPCCRRRRDRTA